MSASLDSMYFILPICLRELLFPRFNLTLGSTTALGFLKNLGPDAVGNNVLAIGRQLFPNEYFFLRLGSLMAPRRKYESGLKDQNCIYQAREAPSAGE